MPSFRETAANYRDPNTKTIGQLARTRLTEVVGAGLWSFKTVRTREGSYAIVTPLIRDTARGNRVALRLLNYGGMTAELTADSAAVIVR
jgi:hypothetical protein